MVETNGFVTHKVLRGAVLLLLITTCGVPAKSESDVTSEKDKWVDSVFQSLTPLQRVMQLLAPIRSDLGDVDEYFGGVVLKSNLDPSHHTSQDRIRPLVGLLSDDFHFRSTFDTDLEVLKASRNEQTFESAGALVGANLLDGGYNFMLFPEQSLLGENNLLLRFKKGLNESGIQLWHVGKDGYGERDAIWSTTKLSGWGSNLKDFKKKDLKKIMSQPGRQQLLFHQTFQEDPHLVNSILASDVLVFEGDEHFFIETIQELLAKKKLKSKVFNWKVKKVLREKYDINKRRVGKPFDPIALKLFKRDLYEQSAVLVKDNEELIPIRKLDDKSFASFSIGVFKTDTFEKSLDKYTYFDHFSEVDFIHDELRLEKILGHYDYVVAGFSFPESADVDNSDIRKRLNFLERVASKTNLVIVVFGGSKWLPSLVQAKSILLSHTNNSMVQSLAPQLIFGALPIVGRLPSDYDGEVGFPQLQREAIGRLKYSFPEDESFETTMTDKIDFIISKAIESYATPGCQVLVARNGSVVFNKAYGYFTYDSIQRVNTETLYDLASVTKVTGTLQASMFLAGDRAFSIDQKASEHLHELIGSNKEDLNLRKILTHQAGLQPYYPFYKKTLTGDRLNPDYYQDTWENDYNQAIGPGLYGHEALEDSLWSWTIASKLRKKEDWREEYDYAYSDLGFFLMFKLNERLLNQPLEEFLAQNFYEPLGMSSTCYQPLCRFPLHSIAPTEIDYDFRNALVWGIVHDENAALTGGVGGHAGLFSTANDLAKLLEMNLRDGFYGGIQYIAKGTISEFTDKQYAGNRRGLGWDKPALGDYKNTAKYSSNETFGHLGFTGTAIWVDPKYDLIYIFLSNRVHPNRENDKLIVDNIRSRVHEVIYESMPEFKHRSIH